RAAFAQLCRYRWHMCRASGCDAVNQCSISDNELRNISYLYNILHSNVLGILIFLERSHHNNSSPHLDSNTDLQHHIQKGYNYAIDNDVNIHRQLEHKLNCFGKQHYQAQALN
ncbi:Uncharacterized protein APZ42_010380, partial [Daphnia magna]